MGCLRQVPEPSRRIAARIIKYVQFNYIQFILYILISQITNVPQRALCVYVCIGCVLSVFIQGSYGHGKHGKVIEFF